MSKNIILHQDSIIAENLSYEEADDLIRKANKSSAGKFYEFYMTLNVHAQSQCEWKVMARNFAVNRAFLVNPESFVVEVDWDV
jgi:hypothetical protein